MCLHYTAEDVSLNTKGILPLLGGDENVLSNRKWNQKEADTHRYRQSGDFGKVLWLQDV